MRFVNTEFLYKDFPINNVFNKHELFVIPSNNQFYAVNNFIKSLQMNGSFYSFEYVCKDSIKLKNIWDKIDSLCKYLTENNVKDIAIISLENILFSNKLWRGVMSGFEFKLSKIPEATITFYQNN